MKISLHWLQDFVRFRNASASAIAERLTISVAEVERVEETGKLLQQCCIGKILTVKKHPRADRLFVCDVKTDRGDKRVVCGGSNLRHDMLVAFAHIGANVRWHGKEETVIRKATIRGEESEGMICAAGELGLENMFPAKDDSEIIDLAQLSGVSFQLSVGTDLREALGLADTIFHIDNHAITHRPDLFSHVGFARECVAIDLAQWKKTAKNYKLKTTNFPKCPLPFSITIQDASLVPRSCAVTLALAGIGTTPLWMRRRLEAIGVRPVSLPVDITNYVAAELGMPLHSFDIADIRGDVTIRAAGKEEHIVTLDGCERSLPDGAIVMSDASGIFDLLGIMGGLRSSTKETTRNILLHATTADPAAIRRTITATGLRTEAATIYEKGIPPVMAERGILRALDLFLALVPAARCTSRLLSWGNDGSQRRIPFSLDRASRTIGMNITKKKAVRIFENLGCTIKSSKLEAQNLKLVVTPPLHRPDLRAEHDLTEELARIHGYDRLTAEMPPAPCPPPPRNHCFLRLRAQAKEEGFLEILPLSLIGPHLLRHCGYTESGCIRVENNLGEDLSLLQPSALPRLLEHAERMFRMTGSPLRTFSIAHTFSSPQEEIPVLALILAHKNTTSLRSSPALLLKGHLAAIARSAGYPIACRPHSAPPPLAHPGQCAELVCRGCVVGELFSLHPAVCTAFDLPASAAAASVNLSALLAIAPDTRAFRAVPLYPNIRYDVTLSRKHSSVPLQRVLEKARGASSLLADLSVADLFDGKPLPQGEYNVTIRCVYRDPAKTLTEDEAKKEHEKVTRALSSV